MSRAWGAAEGSQNTDPADRVEFYLLARLAPNTRKVYARYIKRYEDWCAMRGACAVPASADTLASYFAEVPADWRYYTRRVALSAIMALHRSEGLPLDRPLVTGLRSAMARPVRNPSDNPLPLDLKSLARVLTTLPATLVGTRDRAILLLGFAAALRPNEIVGLDLAAPAGGTGLVRRSDRGLEITLHVSKTDQRRRGLNKLLPHGCDPCPVKAVDAWCTASGITQGVLFPSLRSHVPPFGPRLTLSGVRQLVQRAAAAVPAAGQARRYQRRHGGIEGRSLRSGFVTSAVQRGIDPAALAAHLGWASPRLAVNYAKAIDQDLGVIEQILHWHRAKA